MAISKNEDKLNNISQNSELLKDIKDKLGEINDNIQASNEAGIFNNEEISTRDNSEIFENEIENLSKENELADNLKVTFKDIKDIVNLKNDALEQENRILGNEIERLDGCVSQFTKIHGNVGKIGTGLGTIDGTIGKINKQLDKTNQKSQGFLSELAEKVLGKTIGKIGDFANKWREVNDATLKYGRTLGMSSQELRNFNLLALNQADRLQKYGMSLKDLQELQNGFTDATGRANILTNKQMETMMATSKFVGSENSLATASAVNEMGGSIVTSQGYLATTMERAKMNGLNAKKLSHDFAENIKLASKYSFKNGLNDISKMAALSERLHVNLSNVIGGMEEAFSDIENSISASAKLQVLGGSYAATFGNPLEMMNMAKTDAAGMMKKLQDMVKGKGTFNEESGIVEMSSFDRDLLKEAAKTLNINFDDVLNAVNAEGKGKAIERQLNGKNFDESQLEWIKNNAEFNEDRKQWEVTHVGEGGKVITSAITSLDSNAVNLFRATHTTEDAMANDVHALREHFLGKAEAKARDLSTSSFNEKVSSILEGIDLKGAKALDGIMHSADEALVKGMPLILTIENKIFGVVGKILGAITGGTIGKFVTTSIALIGAFAPGLIAFGTGKIMGKMFPKTTSTKTATTTRTTIPNEEATNNRLRRIQNDRAQTNLSRNQAYREYNSELEKLYGRQNRQFARLDEHVRSGQITEAEANNIRQRLRAEGANYKGNLNRNLNTRLSTLDAREGRLINMENEVLRNGVPSQSISQAEASNKGFLSKIKRGFTPKNLGRFAKSLLNPKNLIKGGIISFGSDAADFLNESGQEQGLWEKGGAADKGLTIASKTAKFAAYGSIVPYVGTIVGAAVGLVDGVANAFSDDLHNAAEANKGTFAGYAAQAGATVLDVVKDGCGAIEDGFGALGNDIFSGIKDGWAQMHDKHDILGGIATMITGIGKGIWDGAINLLKGIGTTIRNLFYNIQGERPPKEDVFPKANPKKETHWYNLFGFAKGGIAGLKHYDGGALLSASDANIPTPLRTSSDDILATVGSGEMILNQRQQGKLWQIANGDIPYNKPTYIANRLSNANLSKPSNSSISLNININGTLKLDCGNGNIGYMDANSLGSALLKNSTFIKQIAQELDRNSNSMFNGGSYGNANSPYKTAYI